MDANDFSSSQWMAYKDKHLIIIKSEEKMKSRWNKQWIQDRLKV